MLLVCVCVFAPYVWVGGWDCPAQTAEGSFRGHGGLVYLRRLALIVPEGGKINRPRVLLETSWVYDATLAIF